MGNWGDINDNELLEEPQDHVVERAMREQRGRPQQPMKKSRPTPRR